MGFQRVVRLSGLEGKFADGDASRGLKVHGRLVLHLPTAALQKRVDFFSGLVFR